MTEAPQAAKRWWLTPLLFTIGLIAVLTVVWRSSEVAREVLAKAVMNIVGTLATPFVLEASIAFTGLIIVLVINQIRRDRDGDEWVYLTQTEPDAASIAAGAETPPKRLDAIVVPERPDPQTDLSARLAIAEGYVELGLQQEAREHLALLSADEQQDPRAIALRQKLEA